MNKHMLIKVAETYCGHTGRTLSTVGTYAAGAGSFFKGLKGKAGCTLLKAEAVLQWFSDHWPADLEWPADVPRPRPAPMRRAG